MDKQRIYLAGGFKSGWQNIVRSYLAGYEFLDPSQHGIDDPKEYTEWDLNAIRGSEIVLAYLEESNPGGYALALEIGYAKALGKFVIFVEECSPSVRHKYFEMIRQVSDLKFSNLKDALNYLRLNEGSLGR